jgi:hypothetical protein
MLQDLLLMLICKKYACKDTFLHRNIPERMAHSKKTITHFADLPSVPGAHLRILTEEIFQKAVQGDFSGISMEYANGIPEQVIEFHL